MIYIARAGGLSIFILHVLGDLLSPPIIGYISDSTHSLQTGLQITWIAVLVTGAYWGAGYYFLPALPLMKDLIQENIIPQDGSPNAGTQDYSLTYGEILCGDCLKLPDINVFGEDAVLNPVAVGESTPEHDPDSHA